VLEKTLTVAKVRTLLFSCPCTLCRSVEGRDLSSVEFLVDAITKKEGETERRLFALLVFIGAGFSVRHICSFHGRGKSAQESSLQSQLFEPLQRVSKGIFPSAEETTHIFNSIYKKNWPLFDTPIMRIGSHITSLSGENLPFLDEKPLEGDKSSYGSLFSFTIHREFRGDKVPVCYITLSFALIVCQANYQIVGSRCTERASV
jgi:hypothetical protein